MCRVIDCSLVYYSMSVELTKKGWIYSGADYSFMLIDEKYHNYETLILTSKYIKVTKHENKTETKAALKERIVAEWFEEENRKIADANNAKSRMKRALKKGKVTK